MALNAALEGRTYTTPEPSRVTSEQIAAFAAAVGSTDPLAVAGQHATATFAIRYAQAAEALFMRDEEAGVDFSRLVHGEESFTHHAPIVPGDELLATTKVARVRAAGGHTMVTLETAVATTSGQARASTTCVVVIRGEEKGA